MRHSRSRQPPGAASFCSSRQSPPCVFPNRLYRAASPRKRRRPRLTVALLQFVHQKSFLKKVHPTVKSRRQSPSRQPGDTTPALWPGQRETGNWGCRSVSTLSDRKSHREQMRPPDHRVRPPCLKTPAPTRDRHGRGSPERRAPRETDCGKTGSAEPLRSRRRRCRPSTFWTIR